MKIAKVASTLQDLKVTNRLLVRNTIRRQGPIARSEVAKATGLTPSTVTVIVNDLIRAGIVRENGHAESSGGRRPVLLELNSRAGYIYAVRLQRGELVTALLDLAGVIVVSQVFRLDTSSPEEVVAAIGSCFAELLGRARIEPEQVIWCGVASPGLIDSRRGVVERSSNLGWEKVQFGKLLSDRLAGLPLCVENISNAAALGEKFYGSGRGCPDLIYLNLSIGISAGIIVKDEIFGGVQGYAGEVGHTTLIPDGGPLCACGRSGCLEALCSVNTVLKRIKAELPDETVTRLGFKKSLLGAREVFSPPLSETAEIRRVIEETGRMIGIAVANLISLFNPAMVILGGELSKAGKVLLDAVKRESMKRALTEIIEPVRIVLSTMSDDPPLMGAYVLALEKAFEIEEWNGVRDSIATEGS